MPFELASCTDTLLNEIAMGATRRAVAQTYRLAMQSSSPTDWSRVNGAIVERWSVSGLTWIKKQAWSGQCFAGNGFRD
jgi:hypothetical protein